MAKKNEESYVAKLGLKVDGSNLKTIERQAKLIETAFFKIGERMPNFKRMGIHDITGMFKELQKAAEQTNITFTKLNKTTIEFRRAFGDNVFETGKMTPTGAIKDLKRYMSEGARISKQYADISSGDAAVARQTRMSNQIIKSLGGDKATKTQWKNELVEQTNNMAEATEKILSELSSDLGAHISKMTNKVNKAGEVVKRIVEVQLNAYQKLRVELNRIQLDEEGNFGISRGKQIVTDTSSTALPKDYNAVLKERIAAEKAYQEAAYSNNEYLKDAAQERIKDLDAQIVKYEQLAKELNISTEAMEKMKTYKDKAENKMLDTISQYDTRTAKQEESAKVKKEKESVALLAEAYNKLKAAKYEVFESDVLGKNVKAQIAAEEKLNAATANYNDTLKKVGKQILELDSYKQKQIATDEKWQAKTHQLGTTGVINTYSKQYDERIAAEKAYWQAVLQGNTEGQKLQQQRITAINTEIAALERRNKAAGFGDDSQAAMDEIKKAKELELSRAQQAGQFKLNEQQKAEALRETKRAANEVLDAYNRLKAAEYALAEVDAFGGDILQQIDAQENLVKAHEDYNNVVEQSQKGLMDLEMVKKGQMDLDSKWTLRLRHLQNQTNKAVKGISEFGKTFYNVFAARASWSIISKLYGAFGSIVSITKELDDAMTDLQIVTGQTNKQAIETISVYADLAASMGTSVQAVAEGNLEWLRQGKTVEESMQLVRSSTMLSKIGAMDAATATKLLTATLNGFNLEAEKAESIVDKLVAVDIAYATSANEIATALQYTAASAQMAGIELDTLVGMITVVSDVSRRAPETIGQSFKTMLARMQNIKVGKFIDDETGEALNDVEKVLNNLGIKLRDSRDSFRDLDEVMAEIAGRWHDLTEVEKSAIATALAGQRQRENMIILFENWDEVIKATNVSLDSAGTSAERYEEVLDSLDAKLNQLNTNWQDLVNNLQLGETFKIVLDLANGFLSVLKKIVNPITVTSVVIGTLVTKNITLGTIWKKLTSGVVLFDRTIHRMSLTLKSGMVSWNLFGDSVQKSLDKSKKSLSEYGRSVNATLKQQSQIRNITTAWNKASLSDKTNDAYLQSLAGENKALLEILKTKKSLIKTNKNVKLTQAEVQTAFKSTGIAATIGAVGVGILKTVLMSVGIGLVIAGISALGNAISKAFQSSTEKIKELSESLQEAKSNIENVQSELQTIHLRVEELNAMPTLSLTEQDELVRLQRQNVELQRQLDIEKELYNIQQSRLQDEAKKYFKDIDPFGSFPQFKAGLENLERYIKERDEYRRKLENNGYDESKIKSLVDNEYKVIDPMFSTVTSRMPDVLKNLEFIRDNPEMAEMVEQIEILIRKYYEFGDVIDSSGVTLAQWKKTQLQYIKSESDFASVYKDFEELGKENILTLDDVLRNSSFVELLSKYQISVEEFVAELNNVPEITLDTDAGLQAMSDRLNQMINQLNQDQDFRTLLYDQIVNGLNADELKNYINKTYAKYPDLIRGYLLKFAKNVIMGKDVIVNAENALRGSLEVDALQAKIEKHNEILAGLFGEDVKGAIDSYEEVGDVLKNLVSKMQDIATAQEEINENGVISAGTLVDLISSGADYVNILEKTENGYRLVDNAATILLQTELTEAKISAEQQLALAHKNVELYEEAKAAKEATQAQLDLAKANLMAAMSAELSPTNPERLRNFLRNQTDIVKYKLEIEKLQQELANTKLGDPSDLNKALEEAQARYEMIEALYNGKFILEAAKKTSSSKDANKEAFEKAYNELKHRLEMNEITQQVYFDSLEVLYKKHFSDLKKYQEEYNKYEEEVYKGRKQLFEAYIADFERTIKILGYQDGTEKEQLAIYVKLQEKVHERANYYRELGEEENKEHIEALGDQWWEYQNSILDLYDKIKSNVLDNLQKDIDRINDEIEDYTTTIDYATYVIEHQINAIEDENDALEEQKDELEDLANKWSSALSFVNDIIDERIELLEQQKDALEKENDEEERAIELEEKRQALERAKTQKTIRVYDAAKGFIWTTDQEAIDEAQKEYDEALKDDKIAAIEEEIDALKKQKDAWADVTDTYEKEQNELIAKELLGSDLQQRILNGDYQALLTYTEKVLYLNDKKIKKTEEKIKSNDKEIESLQELKDAWSEIPDLYKASQDQLIAHELLGEEAEKDILTRRLSLVRELAQAYSSLSDMSVDLQKEYDTIDKTPSKNLASSGGYSKENYQSSGSSSTSNKTGFQLNSSDNAAIDNEIKYLENMKANDSDAGNKQWASEMLNEVKYWSDLANNSDNEGLRKWGAQQLADNKIIPQFSTGGVMYSTGLAMLHGSRNKPEMVLNYDQIKALSQAIKNPESSNSVVYSFENVTIKSDNPSDMFTQLKQYAITHSRNK